MARTRIKNPDDEVKKWKSDDNTSPVEEVAMTVPNTDDPTLPVWTIRMWVLGLGSCAGLAFVNEFFQYRSEPMKISALSATLAALPIGQFMAYVLPKTVVRIPFFRGRSWSFSLNPGPFNIKEHVLITIFANAGNAFGYGGAFAVEMVNLIKIFYKLRITFLVAVVLVFSSQLIGYGWAGLMRKLLIDPAHMWWPKTLVQVTLFRTLHETDAKKRRSGMSRSQLFYTVTIVSFAYYVLPGYFVPFLTCMSLLCLIFPRSIRAQQIGSGYRGLGIGALTLDWAAVASFLESPLTYPSSILVNMAVGAGVVLYIVTPIVYYWSNSYDAQKFPIISSGLFTASGGLYNVTAALHGDFSQGDLYMSTFFAISLALLFAAPLATLSQFLLFHGKETLLQYAEGSKKGAGTMDVHTRLMSGYPDIPTSWFLSLLLICIVGVIVICLRFEKQVQIPWWGVLLGCTIAAILTLPIGVIAATTNMTPSLMVVMQFLGGYLFPGNPIANQGLKLYGHMSMQQAIYFLVDFKLGHYMKIPPRSMFLVQVIGTIVAGIVNVGTAWWLYKIPHICNVDGKLPAGSAWTCPWDVVAFDTTVVWGVMGPDKTYGSHGAYKNLAYGVIAGGMVAPMGVWILAYCFPKASKWIKLINVPVLLGAVGWMPAAGVINYTSWFIVGMFFNFYVFHQHKEWWKRYNYVVSAGLDAGTTIMGLLLTLFLGFQGKSLPWWGSHAFSDHCPLSSCALSTSPHALPNCPLY